MHLHFLEITCARWWPICSITIQVSCIDCQWLYGYHFRRGLKTGQLCPDV